MLTDFRKSSDDRIRYFSGIATYAKDIDVPETENNARLWLDLGDVGDLAEV